MKKVYLNELENTGNEIINYSKNDIASKIEELKLAPNNLVWEGNASGRCVFPLGKVDLNCNKDNYVERKDDGMNIIHIKYVPYPFEVKLLDNYKSFLKYADTQTVFGPARHY